MLLLTDGEAEHTPVCDINRDDDVGVVVLFLQLASLCVHLIVLYKLTDAEKLFLG